MAHITVIQEPVNVNLECDNCCEEINIPYDEFLDLHGCPPEWNYEKVKCPHCGHENTIDDYEFD